MPTFERRHHPWGAASIAALLLAAAAACEGTSAASGPSVRAFLTDSPSRIPVVEVSAGAPSPARPIALLVHGFQCNKSMMLPLARHLAARGLDAYALDLPGHGASPERFSEARARDAVREALDAIVAARKASPERVVLVGHSYGANVLARIAGEGAAQPALVMLGPSYAGGLTATTPGNLLVLTAEREHPHISSFARDLFRDATGAALDSPGGTSGELSRGDARAWQIVPGTGHVSLLFSEDALDRISRWLAGSLGIPSSAGRERPGTAVVVAVLALAGATALARAVAARWPRVERHGEEAVSSGSAAVGWLAAIGATSLVLAALLGRHFTLLAPLRLLEGERIASLLATAGVAMLVLGRRRVPWPRADQLARGLPAAAVAFGIVYLAAVYALDARIYRLSLAGLAPDRHRSAVVLTAALSPFFAFVGAVLHRVRVSRGGGARGAAWAAVATVALCAAAAAALHLVDARLGRFAAPVGALCAFAAAVGAVLTHAARNPAVGALFSSAVTAWVIAVGFVRY